MLSSSSCLTSSSSSPAFNFKKQLFFLHSRGFSAPLRLCHPVGNYQISRRNIALSGIVAAGVSAMESASLTTKPVQGLERLLFKTEGYNFWTWRGHKIHYVEQGEGPPIVLVHGFGASAYHWRYNIPELAKKYKVYAIDLLGFGWSEKAIVDYDAIIWRDQVVDFLKEIVKEPAVVVGNSLGGFTALASAASLPEKVVGVVLLNSAGQFGDPNAIAKPDETEENILEKLIIKPFKEIFQRVVLGFLFWQAKQPARVASVLKSVYINSSNVDDYLVKSITHPASDPKAGEVYYRLMSRKQSFIKHFLSSMAEAIAIGLAVDGAKAVTTAIIARAVEEIRLASWGFKDHLEKLKERLLYIQAFLEDTGSAKQAEKSQLVNRWLQKLVDVAYSADDVMNDYAYEMLRRKVELKNKFRKFFTPTTNPVLFRCHISCRVSKILSELDDLDKDAKFIGLQPVQLAREAVAPGSSYQRNDKLDQVREHADAIGSEFIGRKLDKEKLLPMLLNPTAKEGLLSIVAIIGIGGVGKTTLARRLYEDQKVNEHFRKKKMWICVSEDFNVERLLKEMVESLTSTTKCDLANTDAIIKKLQGELKGERYLLVLDDVWNKNQELWDSLKNVLLKISALEGSVILFTTREIEVLKKSRASYSHELKGLSEDDGWALLKHKVFSDIFPYFHSFEDIGKRIVRRCKFVPLAIKSIGGLLQSKKTVSEWEEIAKSELWELQFEDENYIMPSLLLSYNHLPNASVKQCFAYCAIFPKDELMQKSELMALWLAQGFLQETSETSSSTSTNNAENYFAMLVNYSFLQASQVQEESYGYQMHDLVHDLANYVLKRDLLVCKVEAIPEDASTSHIRYLIFNLERDEIAPELPAMQKLKTIMFWGGVPRWESLLCARYMHTLIIAGIGIKLVPSVIGKLVHLRYLDLSNNAFAALPESICKLYQLQTLRLLNCVKLKDLPTQLCRLVNLIHIPTTGPLYASRGIRQLTRLQTLPRLKLHDRDQGWTINELELLNEVEGEIYISGLQHVKNKEDATKASLGSKNQMLELDLRWDSKDDDVLLGIDNDVLGGLEPHSNVKSLTIIGFNGITFPCWIMMMAVKQGRGNSIPLSNLTEIELRGCRRCQQLPTLGKLRSLRILMLNTFDDVECIGAEFYQRSIDENNGSEFHASEKEEVLFPALTEFHIVDFKKLKAWMPPALSTLHAFPCLETLKIRKCYNLKTVPTQHFRSLKHLELGDLGGTQPFDIIKHNSHGLISLSVKGMEEMELPNCPNLEHLDIRSCQHMKSISSSALIFLQTLIIDNCPSLVYIPDGFSSLRHLQIRNCEVLERIPLNLEDCTSLENLTIHNCPLIKGSGRDLGKLHGLRYLCLVNSGKMTSSWPQWIQQLHRLSYLVISGVDEDNGIYMTTPLPLTLVSNKSLTFLHLIGGSREHEYLPPQLAQCSFPGLQRLTITGFVQLKRLPEWIGNFTSLEALQLARCANLEFLPSQEAMQHLSKLESLSTFRCPLLKARCAEGEGSEWPKISRIRNINIQ